jgi:hypothetical protein
MLRTFRAMNDEDLASWVASHRDDVTLSFLQWVADQEERAEGPEKHALWHLGSKLMALREGLSPLSTAQLSDEVASVAAKEEARLHADDASGTQLANLHNNKDDTRIAATMRSTAALGLSIQGMQLLQQQAMALDATMGAHRARVLTEILGRATVTSSRQIQRLAEADAAGRILEVLLQVRDRHERASMLPDAFTPPEDAQPCYDSGSDADNQEEIFTTPLQLLQAIDLMLRRLDSNGSTGNDAQYRALPGESFSLSLDELRSSLVELREDVLTAWAGWSTDDF